MPVKTLEFKPDLEDAQKHWLAFWAQEIIDRPCCSIRSPKDGVEGVGGPPYMAGAREDFGPIVEQAIASVACINWAGDLGAVLCAQLRARSDGGVARG